MRGRYLRWWGRAITIWWPWHSQPTIYIPRKRLDNESHLERTMAHEMVHVEQWLALGRLRFLLRYLTRSGRLALEAEAFAASCKWWYDRGHTRLLRGWMRFPVLDHYAEMLRDHYWLWYPKERCKAAIQYWLDFT